eukprot:798103-Amphidinium_carterae.1
MFVNVPGSWHLSEYIRVLEEDSAETGAVALAQRVASGVRAALATTQLEALYHKRATLTA